MRLLIPVLAGALLLAPAARADELSDLVDRHRAWRGGEAFATLQGLRAEGELSTSGLSGEVVLSVTREGALRQTLDLGVFRSDEAVGPEGGWSRNQSGQLEDMAADTAEDRRRDVALMLGVVFETPDRLSLRPDAELDGRSFAVVAVDFGDADVHELYLERETGALYGARLVRDRRETVLRYEDWRVVEGVRTPFLETATTALQTTPLVVRWREVDMNPPLGPEAFARPAAEARHRLAGDSTGWIDFHLHAGARVYLPATVNGVAAEALLDSGAEMIVLDRAFAEQIGVEGAGDLPAVGTGGVASAQIARGVTLEIGGLTLPEMSVAILDLSAIAQALGRPLPVILGKDAFNELIVDVDFPHRRIAFHRPESFAPPPDAREVPLSEATGGLRSVPVSIEGRPEAPFDFDIGNGGALIVFPGYAEAEGLLQGRPSSTVLSGAVGGMREAGIARLASVRFAGVELRDVPAVFPPAGPSAVDSDRTVGNLGIGILGRFRLITDYPGDRLWLVPDAEAIAAEFPRDRLGLSLRLAEGAVRVQRVAPGSPAAEAGWAEGEAVAAIDGVPAAELTAEALRAVTAGPAGQAVRFAMADGTTRTLERRDYF